MGALRGLSEKDHKILQREQMRATKKAAELAAKKKEAQEKRDYPLIQLGQFGADKLMMSFGDSPLVMILGWAMCLSGFILDMLVYDDDEDMDE